jgi:hypothetical protein
MELEPLTVENVRRHIADIVSELGSDYRYEQPKPRETCAYFDPDTEEPSCLFGRVSVRMGWPREMLIEGTGIASILGDVYGPSRVDRTLKFACEIAQNEQDRRIPYGDVLKAFDKVINEGAPA